MEEVKSDQYRSYQPSIASKDYEDSDSTRRIIAEDPDWSLATVPLLKDLIITHIANNFACKTYN